MVNYDEVRKGEGRKGWICDEAMVFDQDSGISKSNLTLLIRR